MAKIGIYSDVHISKTSSILPMYRDDTSAYTTRLQMCSDSIMWAYDVFKTNRVDMIVNCGDTFDSHTTTADEQCTYVKLLNDISLKYCTFSNDDFYRIDRTLIGNHDRLNNHFSSVDILSLSNVSKLVQSYDYVDISNWDIYYISFFDSSEFSKILQDMLSEFPRKHEKAILFMHGDINGSTLNGNKKIENRISTELLTQYFDVVINGHIHCHELIYKQDNKLIYNIGSLTSHSFADNEDYVPSCWIFDTDTLKLSRFKNPHAIMFKSYEVHDEKAIAEMYSNSCYPNNPVVLKIKTTIDLKETIDECLKDNENIIKYKFIFTYDNISVNKDDKVEESNINTNKSIEEEFIDFLSARDDLKDDLQIYADNINREAHHDKLKV